MGTSWKHALLLSLATTGFALAGKRMVNGKTTGSTGDSRREKTIKTTLQVAVDETAKVYLVERKGKGHSPFLVSIPGKDLPKVVAAFQRSISLLRAPKGKVNSGVWELGSFLRVPGADSAPKKEEKRTTMKVHPETLAKHPWMANMEVRAPTTQSFTVPQFKEGIRISLLAGALRNGTPVRTVVLELNRQSPAGKVSVQLNEKEVTELLALLRMAPPTYRAVLADRKRAGGRR